MSIASFHALLKSKGHDAILVKDRSSVPCPCRTPQDVRDPEWHSDNSDFPICNRSGFLPATASEITTQTVKVFMQPILASRSSRMALSLNSGQIEQEFGNLLADTQLGMVPVTWNGEFIDLYNWSRTGTDYIHFVSDNTDRKFTITGATIIPDPLTGNPEHHYELNLRLIR